MEGAYKEHAVVREPNFKTYLAKFGLIGGAIALILFGILMAGSNFGTVFIGVGIIMFFVTLTFWGRFNVTYEYIYCDGQFDFDKISGGEDRKHLLRADLDSVDLMAPADSKELNGLNNTPGLRVKDFSSGRDDAVKYAIVWSDKEQKIKVIFEPTDEMLTIAKQKAPRKVLIGNEIVGNYVTAERF